MDTITVIGGGSTARLCAEVLSQAGFRVLHGFSLEEGDRSPLVVGEVNGSFPLVLHAVESGRHVLIASPQTLTPERLSLLLERKKRSQAFFVWSARRYHPGYRFVGSLAEADQSWRPRYVRMETLSAEPTSSSWMRWQVLESLAVLMGVVGDAPLSVAAIATPNSLRNAPDFVSLFLAFKDSEAFVQAGMGEAVERREMLLAAEGRKAFVDELNAGMPLRLLEDGISGGQRYVSCPAPKEEELARQQLFAFLDATLKPNLTQTEADVWLRALSALEGMDRSLQADGAAVPVQIREEEPRFRLVIGRQVSSSPPSVA